MGSNSARDDRPYWDAVYGRRTTAPAQPNISAYSSPYSNTGSQGDYPTTSYPSSTPQTVTSGSQTVTSGYDYSSTQQPAADWRARFPQLSSPQSDPYESPYSEDYGSSSRSMVPVSQSAQLPATSGALQPPPNDPSSSKYGGKCGECGKEYEGQSMDIVRTSLKRHKESKHSNVSYVCPFCNATSGRKDGMQSHIKNMHPDRHDSGPSRRDLVQQHL